MNDEPGPGSSLAAQKSVPLIGLYSAARQRLPRSAYDEAADSEGGIRAHYADVLEILHKLSADELAQAGRGLDRYPPVQRHHL